MDNTLELGDARRDNAERTTRVLHARERERDGEPLRSVAGRGNFGFESE